MRWPVGAGHDRKVAGHDIKGADHDRKVAGHDIKGADHDRKVAGHDGKGYVLFWLFCQDNGIGFLILILQY